MPVGTEVAMLPPEIWAASVPLSSQDLSAPDPAPSCGMQWAEPEHWLGWEMDQAREMRYLL